MRITQCCWWQGVDSLNSKQAGDFSSPWTQRRNMIAAEHTGARLLHLHLASAEDTHARTHTTGKDMHTADLRPGNYTHPKSIEARQSLPFRAVLRPPAQRWPTSNGERFLIGHCSSDRDLIDGSVIWLKHLERVALSDLHKSAVGAPAGCHQARPLYADECLTVLLQVGRRRPDLGKIK